MTKGFKGVLESSDMAAKSTGDNLEGDVELVYTSFKAAML